MAQTCTHKKHPLAYTQTDTPTNAQTHMYVHSRQADISKSAADQKKCAPYLKPHAIRKVRGEGSGRGAQNNPCLIPSFHDKYSKVELHW